MEISQRPIETTWKDHLEKNGNVLGISLRNSSRINNVTEILLHIVVCKSQTQIEFIF